MKVGQILIVGLLVFSCRAEREIFIPKNPDFHFGTVRRPTAYWGVINSKSKIYSERRSIILYFFNDNQVLYQLMSKECLGGNAFLTQGTLENNKLLIFPSDKNWDEYDSKFIVNQWKVVNDSTLKDERGTLLKKIDLGNDPAMFQYFLEKSMINGASLN